MDESFKFSFSKNKHIWGTLLVVLISVWACRQDTVTQEQTVAVKPLPSPDLSKLDHSANFPQAQKNLLEEETKQDDPGRKAEAYGRLGMIYQAYRFSHAALTCYHNAHYYDRQDPRWVYLSGLLHRELGDHSKAIDALRLTIELESENAAAMVALGELEFMTNNLERAQSLFQMALDREAEQTAALIGMGKVFHAQKEYQKALDQFKRALDREPEATIVHYLIALAYRGLGETAKAEEAMAKRGEGLPVLADPLLAEIESLRNDAEAMRRKGFQAARNGRYGEALEYYRQALKSEPDDARVWINVGLCYHHLGNMKAAYDAYQRVLKYSEIPALTASAHYRVGVIAESQGRSGIPHYEKALALNDADLLSAFRIAESLRAQRQFEASLPFYEKALALNGDFVGARLGRVLSLIAQKKWTEAKIQLEKDVVETTDQHVFPHLLSRLLAASPRKNVRDGEKALSLIQGLMKLPASSIRVTHAMALAELGRFDDAVAMQLEAIQVCLQEKGSTDELQVQLAAYQKKKKWRKPWADNDPLFVSKNY